MKGSSQLSPFLSFPYDFLKFEKYKKIHKALVKNGLSPKSFFARIIMI
jgi:hypothetical protein